MELHGLGPVVFYDTAGFDDEGELGNLRVEKTVEVTQKTDMAILVFRDMDISWEMTWYKKLKENRFLFFAYGIRMLKMRKHMRMWLHRLRRKQVVTYLLQM